VEARSPLGEFIDVGILKRVLILSAAELALDREVLHRLHVKSDSVNALQLGLQPPDDLRSGFLALIARLQVDLNSSTVLGGIGAVDADEGRKTDDIGILQNDVSNLLLALAHGGEGNRLRRIGDAENYARVLQQPARIVSGTIALTISTRASNLPAYLNREAGRS
jgi:hypothetical protein